MLTNGAMLLILDLDETLVHASERPIGRDADLRVGQYHVYHRPHLAQFLTGCAERFRLAFWTTGTEAYLTAVLFGTLPEGFEYEFAWGRRRCVRHFDSEFFDAYYIKDLKKVKRCGYDLRRALIVDDTPSKVERHYGNAVYVPPFFGDPADNVLPRLHDYLLTLSELADVRQVEKRGWYRTAPI